MIKSETDRLLTVLSSIASVLREDPSITYWLKDAIVSARKRDIVDAINDAQILLEALTDGLSERDLDRF